MTRFTEKQKQYFKLKDRPPLTLGYIRISPEGRDTDDLFQAEKRMEHDIGPEAYAFLIEKISGTTGWQDREQLKWLADRLVTGDRLVVYGLSQLGRSTTDVLALLSRLHQRGVKIHDIKNAWTIDEKISKKTLKMIQKISAQIDHEVISMRVTEGLAARRAKGLPLGRKKGSVAKSKLDAHKKEIIALLKTGSTKAYITKKFGTSKTNLYHWLRRNKLDNIEPVYLADKGPK